MILLARSKDATQTVRMLMHLWVRSVHRMARIQDRTHHPCGSENTHERGSEEKALSVPAREGSLRRRESNDGNED